MEIVIQRPEALSNSEGKIPFNIARYRSGPMGQNPEIYTVTPLQKFSLLEPELYNTLSWKNSVAK